MSVTTALQSATRKISSMISSNPSEAEILATLKHEHEEVAQMLKKLVKSESGAARKNLVAKIKAALLPHVEAEQKVLYDALIAVGNKKIQQDGKEGYIEHELAASTLAKLGMIANAMSVEFGATAKVLKELIEHHVQEEERNVWADAKEKFSFDERVTMNRKYLAAKQLVGPPGKPAVAATKEPAAAAKAKVDAAPKAAAAPVTTAVPKKGAGPHKTNAPKKAASAARKKRDAVKSAALPNQQTAAPAAS